MAISTLELNRLICPSIQLKGVQQGKSTSGVWWWHRETGGGFPRTDWGRLPVLPLRRSRPSYAFAETPQLNIPMSGFNTPSTEVEFVQRRSLFTFLLFLCVSVV